MDGYLNYVLTYCLMFFTCTFPSEAMYLNARLFAQLYGAFTLIVDVFGRYNVGLKAQRIVCTLQTVLQVCASVSHVR